MALFFRGRQWYKVCMLVLCMAVLVNTIIYITGLIQQKYCLKAINIDYYMAVFFYIIGTRYQLETRGLIWES